MKTIAFIVLLFIPVLLSSQYSYNYLQIQHPQQTWRYGQGTIDQGLVSVRPKGNYLQHEVYMTISAKGLSFSKTDSVEVQMDFGLPKEAVVTDLWLWIDSVTIMKGLILDRWTASSIYENIVKRRRDPALLMKNSELQYSLRIYPMVGTGSRKVKFTYLLPASVNSASVSTVLPMNIFRTSKNGMNKVTVFYWPDQGFTGPSFAEFNGGFEPSPRLDSETQKQYYYGEVQGSAISNTVTLRSRMPDRDIIVGKFVNPQKPAEGFFQVSFNPASLFKINTAKKIVLLFEFDESRSSYSTISMINTMKIFLLANLTKADSVNMIFSGSQIKRVKQSGWIGGDSASVLAAFETVSQGMLQNASNLQALLTDGIDFVRTNGNSGVLWLVASTDKYYVHTIANPAIQSLSELLKPAIPIHITDISNWNVNSSYFNSRYYYGNEYFYDNLSRLSGSVVTSYRQNASLQTNLLTVLEQVRGTIRSFDLITRIETGFCSNRFTSGTAGGADIAADRTITQIGRFNGHFPFILEAAGLYQDKTVSAKVIIPDSNVISIDQSAEAVWAGNYIGAMEQLPYSNSTVKSIVDASLTYRVLSRYSAFLALEPNDTLKACTTCRDETKLVPVIERADALVPSSDSLITAYPNPFNPETKLRVLLPNGVLPAECSLRIFNVLGQIVRTMDLSGARSGVYTELIWNGTADDGSNVSSGMYLAVLETPVKRQTMKLMLMK